MLGIDIMNCLKELYQEILLLIDLSVDIVMFHEQLSVDNLASFLISVLWDEALVVLSHATEGHTHIGEATIMEESLHGNLACEVGEHHYAVVCTLICACISERTHSVCIVEHTVKALDAATGSGRSRRL